MTRTVKLPIWVIAVFLLLLVGLAAYAVLPILQKEEQLWSIDDWREREMFIQNSKLQGPPSFIVSDDDTRERIVTLCRRMEPFRPKSRALEPSHGPSKERAGRPTYVSFGDMRRKETKDGCRIMILNIYDHLAFDHPYRDRPVVELTVYGRGDRGDITENVWYYTIPADDYAELCNILESYSGELASADRS